MVENNALELLVQRLEQLNESVEEEANSIFNILGIIENMIDVMPEVSTLVVERKVTDEGQKLALHSKAP